jgi:hypothetical protein
MYQRDRSLPTEWSVHCQHVTARRRKAGCPSRCNERRLVGPVQTCVIDSPANCQGRAGVVMFATDPGTSNSSGGTPGRHMVSRLAWYAGRAATMLPREMVWRTPRVSHSLSRKVGSRALNRLQQSPERAQAWHFTGEPRYAEMAFDHLDSRLDQDPIGTGTAWRNIRGDLCSHRGARARRRARGKTLGRGSRAGRRPGSRSRSIHRCRL